MDNTVFFTDGMAVWGWNPAQGKTPKLLRAPGKHEITALGADYHHLYAATDGSLVNVIEGSEVFKSLSDITAILHCTSESLDVRHSELFDFQPQDEGLPPLILQITDTELRATRLCKPSGAIISGKAMLPKQGAHIGAVMCWGKVFITHGNCIYQDHDLKQIHCRVKDAKQIHLVPNGPTYYCLHFGNRFTHPDGVLLTARDGRVLYRWHPKDGLPSGACIYFQDEDPYLFYLAETRVNGIGWLKAYVAPLCLPTGQHRSEPCLVWKGEATGPQHLTKVRTQCIALPGEHFGSLAG